MSPHDDHLPNLEDTELPLSDAELEVLRKQFEREGSEVSPQTKFNYAWGLVKSRRKADQLRGVQLLTDICQESPQRQRESLYYLALGHCKLSHYIDARQCIDQLLEMEPNNRQARALRKLIDSKVTREGILGFVIVGGVIATIGITAAYFLRRRG